MLSAPFTSGVIIAAKSRAVTYTPVQISGAASQVLPHSDQGSQYTSEDFQRLLVDQGITSSMSRRGDCWRQCRDGELLLYAEDRARPPAAVSNAGSSSCRHLRLH